MSERTVERLLEDGELRRVKVRTATRVDERDLEAFIARQAQGPEEQAPPPSITDGQLRALHAKAGALDRALGRERGESKAAAMKRAGERFHRTFESASDLTSAEASYLIDWLESELTEASWRS